MPMEKLHSEVIFLNSSTCVHPSTRVRIVGIEQPRQGQSTSPHTPLVLYFKSYSRYLSGHSWKCVCETTICKLFS